MSDTVIQVENLSKQYRLGIVGTNTIRDDVSRIWARLRGKEDPTLKIGVANILDENQTEKKGLRSDYVWALRDINFSLEQGEILGIIGKNGAGKSTLLKILSKVTAPTTGKVKVKGRIASLLEVGTGFHPELSGRENIFLNGAILGMTKAEIRSKFDEIVDFSGVETYIDTPVKRYSSGMYVRLAFAVAAHLEPEILIVDEVLAVGDAEFQKKALGKMQEVSSGGGRTVLFVSHNMASISQLCSKGILLKNGGIHSTGEIQKVVNEYIDMLDAGASVLDREISGSLIYFKDIACCDSSLNARSNFQHDEDIFVRIDIKINKWPGNTFLGFYIEDIKKRKIFTNNNKQWEQISEPTTSEITTLLKIPGNFLVPGSYRLSFAITSKQNTTLEFLENAVSFTIVDAGTVFNKYSGYDYGCVFANCEWSFTD
ncbi:MAG TPA: ABC transporter ATP-binding protein [Bacteroidales bacterium]|nr:ABC transporter ATP-binding protein [Bacteroidales bacterium]